VHCCHLSRRELLQWAAVALTETSAVVTWYTGVPGQTGVARRRSVDDASDDLD